MPSSYHRNYADSVSSIYRDMGRAKAEARLQQGQGWANAIGNIGQTIANIPGQMQDQQQQERRNALTDLQMQEVTMNLDRAKRKDAQDMGIADLISGAMVNGEFNREVFTTAAAARGMGQVVPDVIKTFAESEQALVNLENAQKQGQVTDAALAKLQQDYLRPFAIQLWENKFDPTVVNGAFAALRAQGVPEELVTKWEGMKPTDLSLMVQQLLPKPKAPEAMTLSEGQVRREPTLDQYGRPVMGPDGQPQFTEIAGPEKAQTLEQQLAAASAARNGAEVSRIRNEMARTAAATRAPQQPTKPSFSRAEIVLPDGTIKTANYDSTSGKYTDIDSGQVLSGVGRAPTEKDIATQTGKKQLGKVVSSLEELSEKINTLKGVVATASGKAEKAKASVNLNDDVAEYQSIISAFTPIVARAVGHTGVLTQVDVDSVKAMFPAPEDSKSLRDRKVARLRTLLLNDDSQKPPTTQGGVIRYDEQGNIIK